LVGLGHDPEQADMLHHGSKTQHHVEHLLVSRTRPVAEHCRAAARTPQPSPVRGVMDRYGDEGRAR
jgi:hypothetical protein